MTMKSKATSLFVRAFFLFVFWILLSGKMKPFHLSVGLASAFLIAFVSLRGQEDSKPSESGGPGLFAGSLRAVNYSFWLLKSIVLAALHVSGLILKRKMPVIPEMIHHRTFLKSNLEKVIFAQSITLTPGTITADVEGDLFTIHRLDAASSGDIENGAMETRIQEIFKPRKATP